MEDKHLQLVNKNNSLDFDIILRTDDSNNKYTSIDIFDYTNQEIVQTIKLKE
tara:strand:- start:170 stop:325 length:156 start_codon:yes stop_codon:yes gene_type:complete